MFRWWPLVLWLVYFVFPFDLLPDTFPGIGWTEDFLLLALLYWLRYSKRREYAADDAERSTAGREQAKTDTGENQRRDSGRPPRSEAKDPYRILGIERPATIDEVKRAYRLQASRYHPDKVSHLGEEFQTLAKEKFQEIQWAYEQLLKETRPHGRE